jgi:hypothetical protein
MRCSDIPWRMKMKVSLQTALAAVMHLAEELTSVNAQHPILCFV